MRTAPLSPIVSRVCPLAPALFLLTALFSMNAFCFMIKRLLPGWGYGGALRGKVIVSPHSAIPLRTHQAIEESA